MAKRKRKASAKAKAEKAAAAAAETTSKVVVEENEEHDSANDNVDAPPAKKKVVVDAAVKSDDEMADKPGDDDNSSSSSSDSSSEESENEEEEEEDGEDDADSNTSDKEDPILVASNKDGPKLIVVMEEANLEAVKSNKGSYELLNCDDHLHLHKKLKRNPADSRPDIAHQCLLMLLDSPLNKAGLLQVYMKTTKGILIQINPQLRIPRTYKRFAGLIVQLLHKFKIRAVDGPKALLEVIKNPVTRKLPTNARIIGADVNGTLVDIQDFVAALPDEPVVFVLGAMARGNVKADYIEEMISFSEYPLSAACAISRLTGAFERKYGIL